MPDDVIACIRCGHDTSKGILPAPAPAAAPSSAKKKSAAGIRGVNWLRAIAAVLSSSLFFLASCTAGMFIPGIFKDPGDYGPAIAESDPVPKLATVVASVPDTKGRGQRKSVIVFVASLEEFKKENPDYSFLLAPGNGRVESVSAEMIINYLATSVEPGKIIVKSDFYHDAPPAGLDVRTRYEATDKSIKVLNVKYGSGMGEALIVGLIFAIALLVIGKILKWLV